LKLMFHNVEHLANNFECTFADQVFRDADILLFVETMGRAGVEYDFARFDFRQLVRIHARDRGNSAGSGSIVAVRNQLSDECLAGSIELWEPTQGPTRRVEVCSCTVRN